MEVKNKLNLSLSSFLLVRWQSSASISPLFSSDPFLLLTCFRNSSSCYLKQHWPVSIWFELWPFMSLYSCKTWPCFQQSYSFFSLLSSMRSSCSAKLVFCPAYLTYDTAELPAPLLLKGHWFLKSVQCLWTPKPSKADFQGTLLSSSTNNLKSALLKSRVPAQLSFFSFYFSLSLWPREPPTILTLLSPFFFTSGKSRRVSFLDATLYIIFSTKSWVSR